MPGQQPDICKVVRDALPGQDRTHPLGVSVCPASASSASGTLTVAAVTLRHGMGGSIDRRRQRADTMANGSSNLRRRPRPKCPVDRQP